MSGLARSTYYRSPDPGRAQAVAAADATLRATIEAITSEFPGYRYRRVTHELRRRGTVINHKRVARVMREMAARPRRRFVLTTDSAHDEPIFPNLLRDVQPDGPNQVWVADLTYLRLEREFAYLAVILDAWSRKVVGYAVGHLLDARLPLAALEAALESRRPPPGSFITRIGACSMPRGATASAWRRRGSAGRCRGRATRTTTPRSRASSRR